jgi:hypothetical protein
VGPVTTAVLDDTCGKSHPDRPAGVIRVNVNDPTEHGNYQLIAPSVERGHRASAKRPPRLVRKPGMGPSER